MLAWHTRQDDARHLLLMHEFVYGLLCAHVQMQHTGHGNALILITSCVST